MKLYKKIPENFYESQEYIPIKHGFYFTKEKLNNIEKFALKELLSLEKKNILELGSGTGFFLENLAQEGMNCTGVDNSNALLKSRKNKKAKYLKINLDKPFAKKIKKKYDIVYSHHVIEHLEDPVMFIKEAYKLVKNGGYFILGTQNLLSFSHRLAFLLGSINWIETDFKEHGHIHVFYPDELKEIAEEAGFKLTERFGMGIHIPFTPIGYKIQPVFKGMFKNLAEYMLLKFKKM